MKQYSKDSFGAYFVEIIKKHDFSQAKFADKLKVSRTYLFDIFNGRVKPPTPEMQDKIVDVLNLNETERQEFYNRAAEGRKELPKDIFDYLKNRPEELQKIREKMRTA